MAIEINKPFLPFELMINILTRLPIKSIVRFQCVCKEWKNLFKTQFFVSQHTLHFAHENPFLLIHAYDLHHHRSTLRLVNHYMDTTEVLNTKLINSFRRVWTIVGSSNGLICVELAAEPGRFPISHLLWNPVTNEVREVPHIVYDYGLAAKVGFGYSNVVNDYKIVRFYHPDLLIDNKKGYFGSERLYCVQVYSLNTGSWKELKIGDLRHVQIYTEAAHVNGTIFWYGFGSSFQMLIAFDIATEVFTITPIDTLSANVDVHEYGRCPFKVYEYGNKLTMCHAINFVTDDSKAYNMYMWVIEGGIGESGKSYSCTERYKFGPILYGLQPLCFWRNEIVCRYDRLFGRKGVQIEAYLYLFNLTTKESKKFLNFSGAYDCCAIFNYEKSLCSCL